MNSMNLAKRAIAVSLIAAVSSCFFAFVQAQTASSGTDDSQDNTVASSPSADLNQDSASTVTSSPSNDGNQDGQATVTSSPSTDLNQDGGVSTPTVPSTPTTPSAPAQTTSTGSSGSYSSGGSYYSGGSSIVPIVIAASASSASSSCPLLTGYMSQTSANDPVEVAKLQAFLRDTEGESVSVTGTYDQQTMAGVEAFQRQYLSDIMGPWGATKASGIVYVTTLKKINQIACAAPLTLSAADLSIIDAYKAAQAAGTSTASGPVGLNQGANANTSVAVGPVIPTASASTTGNAGVGSQNVGAVGASSVAQRFWSFLTGLFHR